MSIKLIGDDFAFPVEVGLYSDNTPMVKLPEDFPVGSVHTIVVQPSSLAQFVAAMFLVDSINIRGGWVQHLVLPYVPGARQDRINPSGDTLFTARSVAEMINARRFGKVSILDPHSDVIRQLIKRVHVFPLAEVFSGMSSDYRGIIAPDKGAKDRAEEVAAALGLDVTYASKNRDVSTGKLSGFSVSLPTSGHYLVVDDICDGGGTFMGLGEKIVEQGASADLYVTHGIFSKGTEGLKRFYKNIYTTDSLQQNHIVNVIPVVERMI